MPAGWELVGRREELALLHEVLAEGRASGVVLAGAAGVGKTRLAREFCDGAGDGIAVVWAVATRAASTVPFGPLAHLLPAFPAEPVNRFDVLRRAADVLTERAGGARLLVAVDDAHLLDDASAALVLQLAATRAAFVLATTRTGEPAPDPVIALWKDGWAERVEIQALSTDEVQRLLAAVLGGHVDRTTIHQLWTMTGGNPLYLREVVLAALDSGAIAERHGVWSLRGPLTASARLTELVEARLSGADDTVRALLEMLAVCEPAGAHVLAAVHGWDVLAAAEARGLVTVEEDGRRASVRMAHPLYSETLRAGLPVLRSRALHAAVADAVEATGARRRDDALRLASWRLAAGVSGDAARLTIAARRALALSENDLAERLARAAMAGGGAPFDATIVLAEALYGLGRHDEVVDLLAGARPPDGDEVDHAHAAIVHSAALFWGLGRADEAERVAAKAEAALHGPLRSEVAAHRSSVALMDGRPADALLAATAVLDSEDASPRARARAVVTAVPAWAITGAVEKAIVAATDGLPAALALSDELPMAAGELMAGNCLALWFAGRLDEVDALAASLYDMSLARRADDLRGAWALVLGQSALLRGRVRTAAYRLREAVALLREQDIGGLLPWAIALYAQACALSGHPRLADGAAREAADRLRTVRIYELDVGLARAWAAAANGSLTEARDAATSAADRAGRRGQRMAEVLGLHAALRLGAPVAGRLSSAARGVEGAVAAACAQHADAIARGDGRELDAASGAFEAIGLLLAATEAAVQAADEHRDAGRTSSHLASLERARTLHAECEGARTPVVSAMDSAPSVATLTQREREIAELAARGMTKREIAEHLVVSVRTVGNHLYNLYAKLGVSSREELSRVLRLQD
jgi:DNA-binding CsgD family transcriptional regulator